MEQEQLDKSLWLIQWYYKFLYLWLFMEDIIKENDISEFSKDIDIRTWKETTFKLKKNTIEKLLKEIYENPHKQNILWYFTQLTMFRWITLVMKEVIDTDNDFKVFLQKYLKKWFFEFEQIIRFTRNVLSHSIDTNILIKKEDYEWQKIFLLYQWKTSVDFNFQYSKIFKDYWKWNKDYWIRIKINFKKLWYNNKFFEIISIHELFLLSELCYNMIEIYKFEKNKKVNKKIIWKSEIIKKNYIKKKTYKKIKK